MKIPNDWNMAKFGELAKITCGVAATPEYVDAAIGVPFLSARNVQKERLDLSYFQHIPRELHEKLTKNTKPAKGDVLLTRVGAGIGEAAVVDIDFEFSVYVSLTLIKCGKYLDSEYVKSLLNTNYYRYLATRDQFAGGGVQNLNVQMVKEYPIPVPPLPEQKKIAKILSTWDKAITTTEQLLVNSQQQKKALMQQLLTGPHPSKPRLLDQNGERFSGEWRENHLRDVSEIVMGSSPKSSAYNETGDGMPLIQGNADIKHRLSAPRIHTSEITKECSQGDILLSVRAPVGKVAISQHEACIGRGISSIKAKSNESQDFLYQWLLWFEPRWGSLSQGSTFESINSDDIKSLKMKIPYLEEQQKIAAVLSTADQEISTLQQKLDALKQEKKALMQQLLTGKRRVKLN
ncbi:restriction endonuclease subunit S [Shewanella algae]|uniref:restriction endonuclease subunit S n=1 Tax=Shewanella algae TaxID=38313 RepID=UPI003AAC07A8